MIKVYGREQSAIGFYITKIAGAPNRAGRPLYRVRQGEIGGTTDIPITDPENYRRVFCWEVLDSENKPILSVLELRETEENPIKSPYTSKTNSYISKNVITLFSREGERLLEMAERAVRSKEYAEKVEAKVDAAEARYRETRPLCNPVIIEKKPLPE